MFVLRPVREDDLEAVIALTRLTTPGLTTLPSDEKILGRRIRHSLDSFHRIESEPVAGDEYFLVLEAPDSGGLVGTSAVVSKVGGFEPFYAYRVETRVHESKTLGVCKEIRILHLVVEHDGPSEIGTLFLAPAARHGGNGRLLSLGRFLLIAEYPQVFDETVIAEMRGVVDAEGGSVFWEALGRHFFDVDLPTADFMSIQNKRFIADLMPRHPIYIPTLPKDAQDVIGRVHPLTEPALNLLEAEGFRDAGMVDIFEAGPVIECPRDQIRTLRESRIGRVVSIREPTATEPDSIQYLVTGRRRFSVGIGPLSLTEAGKEVAMSRDLALALGIEPGEEVRFAPLRSSAGILRADRPAAPNRPGGAR